LFGSDFKHRPLKLKIFTALLICNILISLQAPAQEPVLQKLEGVIAENKNKLTDPAMKAEDREKIYTQIAYDLNQSAEIHFSKNEYEVATKLFVEADEFTKKFHESYYARYKKDLANAESKFTEYDKEPNKLRRETLYKIGRTLVSILLSELITEAKNLDDEKSEKLYLQKLVTVSREISDTKGEAKAYEKLGAIEINNDNSQAAFELYNKAFVLRKINSEEWWTLNYMAYGYWQLGDYKKAIEHFEQEIAFLRDLERKPVDTTFNAILEKMTVRSSLASTLFNVAQIKMIQGKYGEATKAISGVNNLLVVLESEQNIKKDETINSLLTLTIATHKATLYRISGRILEAQGKDEEALKNYMQAIDLFSQLSGGKPSGAIATLRGRIALIYTNRQKFDEARANILEVLRLRSRLQQPSGTVYGLIFAARIERAAKKTKEALKFARRAKSSALQLSSTEEYVLAEANETEADILVDSSQDQNSLTLEQAIVSYRTAIETYRKSELLPSLARCLNSLGWAYEKAGKVKEAEAAYIEAIKITESIQSGFATKGESEAYGNKRETAEIYKRMVDLLVKQGRVETALQYATRAQRKDLIDAVPKSEIKLTGKGDANLKLAAGAESKIQAVRSNIEKSKTETGSVQQKNNMVSTLGNARQQYALAIKRLEIEQPGLRFTVRPIDLLKLQATISPTEAVLSYLITKDKIYLFVVNRTAVAVKTVDMVEGNLTSMVAGVRTGLNEFGKNFYAISMDPETGFAEEKNRPDLRKADTSEYYKKNLASINADLTSLYKILISPAEDLLKGVQTIKIIPNGELFLLPFTALISPDDKQYLIEKYNIVFLTAGDLISPSTLVNKGTIIAFGNPTEADLDGALEEVKAIQTVYPGTKIYTKDAATKGQLFKIKSAKILHLATHGHILSPLELSNIQLAHLPGIDQPDLTFGEIYALPVESMEMVVLSACQTALGTVSGTEIGVFIEAFRIKAKTVVASLWSVDDLATKILMTEFYKNLNLGKTRAAAMRTAQLKLIKDKRTKNPLFWAAFVLYGEGGKL
jgi:tetratricopeptide (TPR) repeat protein